MYGLPKDFDVAVLVERKLDLLCFTANTISFTFDGNAQITIMGAFIYRQNDHEIADKQIVPLSTSNLMGLIGKKVCRAASCQDGTLTLHFDNRHILTILDDSQQYESYTIRLGDKDIIV